MARPRNLIRSSAICIIYLTLGLIDLISSQNVISSRVAAAEKFKSMRCLYTTNYHYGTLRSIYSCEISGRIYITRRGTAITNADGVHIYGRNHSDVRAFKGDASVINYFPKDLDKIFPNLMAILLNLVQLKEIRQVDIKAFPELKYLDLFENKIEFLEADLFKFNKKLEIIWLSNNKIKFIDDTVFQGIANIKSLYLGYNECISKSVTDNPSNMSFFMDLIKIVCGNKSKNSKYNPKDLPMSDDDYDDDNQQQPDDKPVNETAAVITSLKAQLRVVEDEVTRLKLRREQTLIWLIQVDDENKKLKAEQNESLAQIASLQENLKNTQTSGTDFVKQIFALRTDLNKQSESTNGIIVDLKARINSDKETLKKLEADLSKIREQNSKLYEENRRLNEDYGNLRADKDNRDFMSITVIVIMGLMLVGMIGFKYYTKIRTSPTIRKFNDFENATMKLVDGEVSSSMN